MRHVFFLSAVLALSLPLAATASDHFDKINGSVHVEAGTPAGDVGTINGSITIDANATVQSAHAVNGSVELGEHAQAGDIRTANGAISLAAGSHVSGAVKTANGHIQLDRGATVGGSVGNVNGSIELVDAQVGGGLETTNGSIDVGAGSHIEGGILANRPSGNYTDDRLPRVVIGPHAVVQGALTFNRPVVLQVSDNARIGPVQGATVVRFHGDAP